MKRVLTLAVVLLCLSAMVSCGDKGTVSDNGNNTSAYESNDGITDTCIKTPYCDLIVPDEFVGNVKSDVLSQDPYVIAFKTVDDDTLLFSLAFDSETENLLGTLELDERNVVIYASFGDFDSSDANYEIYCTYQEGINTILENLMIDYQFTVGQIVVEEDNSTFDIQTSVVTMKYPNKWKEKVAIDVTNDAVKFECNGIKLFDLLFVECDGYLLGTYNDTPIYIVDYLIDKGNLSEAELYELYAMQEDVNVILQYLMEDDNFKISR